MYTINDDLKAGKLRNIYLLYGTEHYLVARYKKKLLQAFCDTSDAGVLRENMNFTFFQGKEVRTEQIKEISETLPFLADRRLILVEDSGLLAREGDELAE